MAVRDARCGLLPPFPRGGSEVGFPRRSLQISSDFHLFSTYFRLIFRKFDFILVTRVQFNPIKTERRNTKFYIILFTWASRLSSLTSNASNLASIALVSASAPLEVPNE